MNKIKVEKIVDIFCDNLKINNNRYRNIIKELMINIIEKYEKCGISTVKDEQQYIIKSNNNEYSIEDFFLNRLLFNVTNLEIKDTGGRAEYSDYLRQITLNRNKLTSLLDGYTTLSFTDEQKFLAAKKVVMHEFEHALQTSFEKGPYTNDLMIYKSLYNRLLNANLNIQLNDIYSEDSLLKYAGNGRKIQSGLLVNNDLYKKYCGTFYLNQNDSKYTSENNINEIFNESESLIMSGSDEKIQIVFPSGNRVNIRNLESSNFLITNYGFMLKLLLGEQRTFEGMYLNRDVIIKYFNANYGEIFEQVFGNHFRRKYPNINIIDGWSILHMAINEAKYSYENGAKDVSEVYHKNLNLALTLCFEKMIKQKINSGESFDSLKEKWNEFTSMALYNSDSEKNNELPHMQILNTLKEDIKKSSNNQFNQNQPKHTTLIQIPTFAELKSLASKYELFIDSKNPLDSDISKIKIRDIETGQIQTEQSIITRAIFANIWLNSAGITYYQSEERPGERYAFNESAEKLYNVICRELYKSCKNKGVIDTIELFRNIDNYDDYKYNREIIVNLFRTPYQTEMINKLFLQSLGINNKLQTSEPLYTMSYAGELAFSDENTNSTKGR